MTSLCIHHIKTIKISRSFFPEDTVGKEFWSTRIEATGSFTDNNGVVDTHDISLYSHQPVEIVFDESVGAAHSTQVSDVAVLSDDRELLRFEVKMLRDLLKDLWDRFEAMSLEDVNVSDEVARVLGVRG